MLMHLTHPQNVFKKREKINMGDAMKTAKLMWDAYAIQAGGKTFDGKPLPTWDELGEDRQSCWIAAASVAASRIEKLEEEIGVLFAANVRLNSRADLDSDGYVDRIEKLEAALKHCINALHEYEMGDDRPRGPIPNDDLRPWLLGAMDMARKTLEGKND